MYTIPNVPTADELIERAFHRAAKVVVADPDHFYRSRKITIAKLQSVTQGLDSALSAIVRGFPSFDSLHPFQKELLDLLVDLDKLKKALSAPEWARKRIQDIAGDNLREMHHSRNLGLIEGLRAQTYGRIASIVKQIKKDLNYLARARERIRKLPMVFPESPTVVIAGYPNVGKSMLVSKLSTAKPAVAPYPFTTKGIIVGHFVEKWRKYQVIDTPGLLDRPLNERNDIELQAVLALRHLADVLVFLIDPTDECGATVETQHELLEQIRKDFPNADIIVVETKSDILKTGKGTAISAKTGEGLDALKKDIFERLKRVKKQAPGDNA